ncbi:cAMP-binding domain of CRP or a regulatory subunit of cAMP-dependent protein kinases [Mucilaginibacter pineti]|uniref:cAMP-binding domain of CRP or a regulatory subunit of cAMP-dependent protein kinases n=1 Tax=Mucilaginibacter pineti TaxID=1391627 RepID=A0A1G6Z4E1_9SPHI|nr:Crp/Fnr family transcriptional regulator [Mucilaginibacter pineti]SDD97143.1 cAMP-binding domain of CRP or a regulatory subunit of cAMP-dependent protein kinases [Mucilaginibacter pineti]
MSLKGIFPIDRWNFNTPSVLSVLSKTDRHRLLINSTYHQYAKGESVFKEGTVPSGIYLVMHGKIKKYKAGRNGREQIIYVASKGELVGYHAVLSEERYPDSAAAMEPSEICYIPNKDFIGVIKDYPYFAHQLLKILSHEFTVMSNNISVIAQSNAPERLAIALIVLREKYKDDQDSRHVMLTVSRADLAHMASIAEENVIRLLKEFKEEGILETDGRKISIKDIKLLVKRANYK